MKSKLIDEFKQFAMRGNVIDLAVGVVIGAADLGITLKQAQTAASGEVIPAVTINYGNFLQATFDFIIIAFAIFLFIKLINRLNRKKETETPATPPAPPADVQLLTEIRDLLKKQETRQ